MKDILFGVEMALGQHGREVRFSGRRFFHTEKAVEELCEVRQVTRERLRFLSGLTTGVQQQNHLLLPRLQSKPRLLRFAPDAGKAAQSRRFRFSVLQGELAEMYPQGRVGWLERG